MAKNLITKGVGKRALAVFLSLVMMTSLLNIGVVAAGKPAMVQNFEDTYYHQDGTVGSAEDWEIHLSKTAEETDEDNVFNITLSVETKDISTQLAGATHGAVVLVLDVSSSMDEDTGTCVKCGEAKNHSDHRNGPGKKARCTYEGITHLDLLKTAVNSFLSTYAADAAAGDKRMVSIAKFATDAQTVKVGGKIWIDVSDPANLSDVQDAVSALNYSRGTNIEGGLVLGRNLLNMSDVNDIPEENQSLILFSDGSPTTAVDDVDETSTTLVEGGNSGSSRDDLDDILEDISAKKQAVAYNTDASLLKSVFGAGNVITSTASTLEMDLTAQAGKIVTTKTNASTITDPMGIGVTMVTVSSGYDSVSKTWDLSKATPVVEDGVTAYTITYQVEIDPLQVAADSANPGYTVLSAANGTTTLNYTVGDSNTPVNAAFTVPNIRGVLPAYTLTVNYVDEAGDPLADQIVEAGKIHGAAYTTEQKTFEGYTFRKTEGDAVSGTMNSDKEVTYVYEKDAPPPPPAPVYYTLTVNYVDEGGAAVAESESASYQEGTAYSTAAKSIEGYTFRKTEGDAVSGTMNGDKEVTYVYEKVAPPPPPAPKPEPEPEPEPAPPVIVRYRVVYEYVGEVPAEAPPVPATERYQGDEKVVVADEPVLEGYVFSGWSTDRVTVTDNQFKMPRKVVTFTGSWEKIPEEYTLTVRYVDENGAELAEAIREIYTEGDAYTTQQKDIEGYTFLNTSGDAVDGTMNADVEVVYVYSQDEIEIPEEDVPLAGIPDETEGEDFEIEIPEEDVPLADVPKTGDESVLWIAAIIASVLGLAWLDLNEKKRQKTWSATRFSKTM